MNTSTEVNHPILKGVGAFTSAMFASITPSALAAYLAAILNLLLIVDWIWKRLGKPYALRKGWIVGKAKGYMETTDRSPL